ncbi:unnamed protein product [Candida verbasci]|uniref:NADH dehydrogenase [ubiquinone] 1 alpha subcomplex subunit n=1 Tax=Candida verbasci TaxID=1227364 RepID=A0A9W4TZF7_9ASCO|nr:unnamed protein product [Candida verbasci]
MDIIKSKYPWWKIIKFKFQARRDVPFRRKWFVGYDLYGNTYWEFTIDGNLSRLRRKTEPYKPELFQVDYFKNIPPQWLQWLRRTRERPPSLNELIEDQLRQQRLKILSQQADVKWRNEKMRLENELSMKLQNELDKAKIENEEYKKIQEKQSENNEDPWRLADETRDKNPIEEASVNIKLREEVEDPWKSGDETRDKNPIEEANINIKPRH